MESVVHLPWAFQMVIFTMMGVNIAAILFYVIRLCPKADNSGFFGRQWLPQNDVGWGYTPRTRVTLNSFVRLRLIPALALGTVPAGHRPADQGPESALLWVLNQVQDDGLKNPLQPRKKQSPQVLHKRWFL